MAKNWTAGDLIKGRYRLISLLGKGGMGSVWRAQHTELMNEVAVKLLDPSISSSEEMIGRFLREARAAASLKSRHVIRIFDHGVEDGEAFMVMELLEGETLGERLKKRPLPVEDTIKFMVQVMRAMALAHEAGIIHRDLKPENIFITHDDEGEFAKVLDFGVAKVGGDLGGSEGVKTQTGMMLGTPFYMSPEQAKAKEVDARTDIWAMAVITYECLVGKRPFLGDSFADLVLTLCTAPIPLPSQSASVPIGFDEWFLHATQRDVERRIPSSRVLSTGLLALADAALTGTLTSTAIQRKQDRLVAMSASGALLEPGVIELIPSGMQNASVDISSKPPETSRRVSQRQKLAAAFLLFATASLAAYALLSDGNDGEPFKAPSSPLQVISLDPPPPVKIESKHEERTLPKDSAKARMTKSSSKETKETSETAAKPAIKRARPRPRQTKRPRSAPSTPPKASRSTETDNLPPEKWEF